MKRTIFAGLLSVVLGTSVLFAGCGTDYSNDITDLQQQITTLSQTVTELQSELTQSKEEQDDILLDLTTTQGQLQTLQERVYGKTNNNFQINDTVTYTVNGIKLFDLTITEAYFHSNSQQYVFEYEFESYVDGFNINSLFLDFNLYFYSSTYQTSYDVRTYDEQYIILTSNVPSDVVNGVAYLYMGSVIFAVYDISFGELSN